MIFKNHIKKFYVRIKYKNNQKRLFGVRYITDINLNSNQYTLNGFIVKLFFSNSCEGDFFFVPFKVTEKNIKRTCIYM